MSENLVKRMSDIVPGDVEDLGAIEDACAKGRNVRHNCLVTPKTAMIFDTEKLV